MKRLNLLQKDTMKANFDPMIFRLETFNIITPDVGSQLKEMISSDDKETYVMARDFVVSHYYESMSAECRNQKPISDIQRLCLLTKNFTSII